MEKKYWVPALKRATDVLNLITESQVPLNITEISKIARIDKSTLFSLLNTMCSLGLLYKNKDETYSLGKSIGVWGARYFNQFDILKFFNMEAKNTVEKINQTIQLSILDDGDLFYLGKQKVNEDSLITTFPGMRLPAYATAMGKVHLSQFTYEQLLQLYPEKHLVPLTPYTVKDVDSLWGQIESFRHDGYVFESQEASMGFSCIAVPIYNYDKKIIAAISATLTETIRSSKHDEALIGLLDLSRRLSRHAGYTE